MIRPTTPEDAGSLIALAGATGLFPPEGLDALRGLLEDYFSGPRGTTDRFWMTDDGDGDGAVGVVYCEPERMADRTWNLQLIAVHPSRHRRGRGGLLLQHVEQALRARNGRLLIVETSGQPEFEFVRAFYRKHEFDEEARIRDFYQAGDDKIVFRRALTP